MPPRIWRRAFHEAYRADEGIDDAGVVAHAGNRAQALVQGVGILAGQLPRLLDAEVAEVLDHRRADVGDVGQAPGLARVACLGHLQRSTHWPPECKRTELGRESCWVRECQYAWILVVAVFL